MVHFDDHDISLTLPRITSTVSGDLEGWTVRVPSPKARWWSVLNGLAHGAIWAFPFLMMALTWRRFASSDNNAGTVLFFTIGMVLLILFLIKGIIAPRTWWFAYTEHEIIIEHGIVFEARDYLVFDRVQYLERRAGPIMKAFGMASLVFDTAAGRATIPAASMDDIDEIETLVRAGMQRAAVV
jgi:membrane protein YdbS with pleckstrin-like domain